ncbi:MAG: hypothetical protein M1379_05260 [Firmicutes bacterium]|nr:hypothetical protein [Bacillota bacterium]
MGRLWDQLSGVVAEKLHERIECDIDVRRPGRIHIDEIDVDTLVAQVPWACQ